MRRPDGYAIVVDPDGGMPQEWDTARCIHCQAIIHVKPGTASTVYLLPDARGALTREEMGAFCRTCMGPICLPCHNADRCVYWERQLDELERAFARERLIADVLAD